MPVESPDGTGGLVNILRFKPNNFAGDFVSHFCINNEAVELLVFKIIFNQNTLTVLFSFNNQKRLRFWRFLFLHR
jgi:hypothetical protein